MRTTLNWTGGMKFEATADGKAVLMDAKRPIGTATAQTPKELVAAGLGGCTAMDVVALLKKHKQDLKSLQVDVDIETVKYLHTTTFGHAAITFTAHGTVDPQILLESVRLSQTRYCGVSAMLVRAFPIDYTVILNGEEIGTGKAEFAAE